MTGLDARWGGFLSTYAGDKADWPALTTGLGRDWRIHRSSIKPYASRRGTHAAIDAMLKLRGEGASPENLADARIRSLNPRTTTDELTIASKVHPRCERRRYQRKGR